MIIDKGTLYDYIQHQQGNSGGIQIILASQNNGSLSPARKIAMAENGGPLDAGGFIDKQASRLSEAYLAHKSKIINSTYSSYLRQKCSQENANFDGVVAIIALESRGEINIKSPSGTYIGIFQINKNYQGVNPNDPISSIDWYFKNRRECINSRRKQGISDDGSFIPNSGGDESEAKQIDELKKRIDLDAFLLHNAALEKHQVNVSWGSRANSSEYSDWIGLKQFILFLIKTYQPHKLVPFVELIPKFTFEGNAQLRNSSIGNELNDALSDNQTTRYNKMVDIYNSLRDTGGIDLMTIDPFLDLPSYNAQRGLSFKTIGNLTFDAAAENGTSTSKPGGIGVESITVEMGEQSHQGLTMVTIVMKDIMGNKFLDPASPWSFILNKPQYGGDFFFRFGWQLTLPKDDKELDSTGYKFWNHEGWKLFGEDFKNKFISKLKLNDYTINFTQSLRDKSLFYNGWKIIYNFGTGNKEFIKDLITYNEEANVYYMSLNMMLPTISVDPNDGSITATMVFQTTSDMANFMAPIFESNNVKKVCESSKNNIVTLYDLIIAFIDDNEEHINNLTDEEEKKKLISFKAKKPANDTLEERSQLIQVIPVEDYKTGMTGVKLVDPKEIEIVIKEDDIKLLQANTENNTTLWSWLVGVLAKNNLQQAPTSNSQSGTFNFLYDNGNIRIGESGLTLLDQKQLDDATGYLTSQEYGRILSDDDVFSFRFQGSLIQELKIEETDEETAQSIGAINNQAQSDLINNGYNGTVNAADLNEANSLNPEVPKVNKLKAKQKASNLLNGMINFGKAKENNYTDIADFAKKMATSSSRTSSEHFVGANEMMRNVVSTAMGYLGTKETPVNTGELINLFQASTGNQAGQPWCMSFVYFCFQKVSDSMGISNPLVRTGGVLNQWNSINPKFKTNTPSVGSVAIFDFGGGRVHTGIVISVSDDGKTFESIEGNTNERGSRESGGVFIKKRTTSKTKGFINFATLSEDDVQFIEPKGNNFGNPYLVDLVQNNSINTKNDMLKIHLSKMRNANVKMLGHPWLQLGRSFYIKGTGEFDGKYIFTKIEHKIENNDFTTNAYGVSIIFNDALYAELQAQKQYNTLSNSTLNENISENVGKKIDN